MPVSNLYLFFALFYKIFFYPLVPETSAILPKAESSKVKSSKVESKDNSKKAVTTNIDETDGQQDDFTKMDIRVGKITKVYYKVKYLFLQSLSVVLIG